jgi:hypothetical protein
VSQGEGFGCVLAGVAEGVDCGFVSVGCGSGGGVVGAVPGVPVLVGAPVGAVCGVVC